MAQSAPAWPRHTEGAPATPENTRQRLTHEVRGARRSEPGAAAADTDSETGTPAARPQAAAEDPARTAARQKAKAEAPRDVRIGPGDAGAADTPRHGTVPVDNSGDTWGRAFRVMGIAAAIAAVVLLARLLV